MYVYAFPIFVVMLFQVPGIRPSGEQSQPPLPSYRRNFVAASAVFSGIYNFTDAEIRSADFAGASRALLRRVLLPTGQLQRRAPQYPPLDRSPATARRRRRSHRGLSKVTPPREGRLYIFTDFTISGHSIQR